MTRTKRIVAEIRPDWIEPFATFKHVIPVVIESNHPRFVAGTRLDFGFLAIVMQEGYNVKLVQPKKERSS